MRALNDKLMLQDILAHLRDLMTQCGLAVTHSNCQKMRDMVTTVSGRTTKHQFEVFEYMNEHGMYPIKNVDDTELKAAIAMHAKKG